MSKILDIVDDGYICYFVNQSLLYILLLKNKIFIQIYSADKLVDTVSIDRPLMDRQQKASTFIT